MSLILPLSEAAGAGRPLVGGKAENLGRLHRAGLPVPDGFVVTTDAFRALSADPAVHRRIEALAELEPGEPEAGGAAAGARSAGRAGGSPADAEALRRAARADTPRGGKRAGGSPAEAATRRIREAALAAREAIGAGGLPAEVREAVVEAYEELRRRRGEESPAVAVRSSATAEDLEEASFAGQHDTFLGVRTPDGVLEAVRACMASLYTDRAVAYRARAGIPDAGAAMAVVVQEMVPAQAAGVLFTADPVSGNRRIAVVEATFGLGDVLVGGEVDADGARIDRRTGDVLSREPKRDARVLDDGQLRALLELGEEVEALFSGRPQDVEWCLGEGRFFLLQARPITALPPVPEPAPDDGRLHVYVNMGPLQAVSEPMPPLARDTWSRLLERAIELGGMDALAERWCAEAAGRVYFDVTPVLRIRLLRGRLTSRLADTSEPAAAGLAALLEHHPEAFRGGGVLRALVGALRSGAAGVLARLPRLAASFLGAFRGDPPDLDEETAYYERFGRRLAASIRRPTDPTERVRRALNPVEQMTGLEAIFPRLMGLMAGFAAGACLERLFPDATDDVDAAGRGFPREVVTRMNQELGDVADVARRHPGVAGALRDGRALEEVYAAEGGEAFREAFGAYLEAFGHRATGEIDVSNPRWREDPSTLVGVVRANLAREAPGAHREHLRELVAEGEAAADRLVERASGGPLGFLRKRIVRRLLRTYRGYLPTREIPKHGIGRYFAAIRESLLGAGRHLAEAGELERAGDVWFLRAEELLAALEEGAPVEADVAARRADHQRHRAIDAPVLLTSEGEDPNASLPDEGLPEGAYRGTGVSAGVVEGIARVVRDPAASSVEPGEILVVPSCGPGWTPLYLNAAGLVSEVGGRMSHGALVAREYGLPAVLSVTGATRGIRSGQRVRVDGSRGVVEVLEGGDRRRPGH